MPDSPLDGSAAPRHDFHVRRHLAAVGLEQRLAVGGRPALDELELEERGGLDDVLRARDVGDAGQLHQQLIPVVAVLRDVRLGDAELVDAAVDRVVRLHHRLFAQAAGDVGLHRELVGAAGPRRSLVVDVGLVVGDAAELGVLVLRHALDAEGRGRGDGDGADRDAGGRERLAQLLAVAFGRDPQRIVAVARASRGARRP